MRNGARRPFSALEVLKPAWPSSPPPQPGSNSQVWQTPYPSIWIQVSEYDYTGKWTVSSRLPAMGLLTRNNFRLPRHSGSIEGEQHRCNHKGQVRYNDPSGAGLARILLSRPPVIC